MNELYLTIALYLMIAFFLPMGRVILDRTLEIAYRDDIYILTCIGSKESYMTELFFIIFYN